MIKIGFGRDIHSLSEKGRDLILGGVKIPYEKKVKAHSDGDILYHALGEAIFGALGMNDLGAYFPDTSASFENMDSSLIVKYALVELKKSSFKLNNVDISIICEKPKLKSYIQEIKNSVKTILNLPDNCVAIKAQTNEHLDAIGNENAIEVICALLIESN